MTKYVTVQWYGQILKGELVERKKDGSVLDSMLRVRIPVQGVQVVALFHPSHVYSSEEELIEKTKKQYSYPKNFPKPEEIEHVELERKASTVTAPSEAWQRLQQFKAEHWDEEKNHLQLDALDEFYQLWRLGVAEKRGIKLDEAPVIESKDTVEEIIRVEASTPEEKHEELVTGNPLDLLPPIEYKKPTKPIVATQLSLF